MNEGLVHRGYRTFLNCPVCRREVLTVEQAHYLTNAIHIGNRIMAETYLSAHGCRLLILAPRKLETAQLTSHRILVAPICKSHRELDPAKLERLCLLGSRLGQILEEKM